MLTRNFYVSLKICMEISKTNSWLYLFKYDHGDLFIYLTFVTFLWTENIVIYVILEYQSHTTWSLNFLFLQLSLLSTNHVIVWRIFDHNSWNYLTFFYWFALLKSIDRLDLLYLPSSVHSLGVIFTILY